MYKNIHRSPFKVLIYILIFIFSAAFVNTFPLNGINTVMASTVSDILFSTDFEDGSTSGWTTTGGTWKIVDNGGNKAYAQINSGSGISAKSIRGQSSWTDYSFEADVKPTTFNNGGVSMLFRAADTENCYLLYVTSTSMTLTKRKNSVSTDLKSYSGTFTANISHRIKIVVQGSKLEVYLDYRSNPAIAVTDNTFTSGKIGFETWQTAAQFDNIKVRSVTADSASVLFRTDFEDGSTAGWVTNGGSWSIAVDSGSKVYCQTNSGTGVSARALIGQADWADYSFEADVKPTAFNNGGISLLFRTLDKDNCYILYLTASNMTLTRRENGIGTDLNSCSFNFTAGVSHNVRIVVSNLNIQVFMEGALTPTLAASDSKYLKGKIGFETWQASAQFDNVKVKDLSTPFITDLLRADFESGSATDWSASGGKWVVQNDNGNKVYAQTKTGTGVSASSTAGLTNWTDYSFKADVKPTAFNGGGVSLLFRTTDTGNGYLVYITPTGMTLQKRLNWTTTDLGSYAYTFNQEVNHKIKISVQGSQIEVYMDDKIDPVIAAADSSLLSGNIGFETWQAGLWIDNIVVEDLSPSRARELLYDDFEDSNAAEWSSNGGKWTVVDDSGNKMYAQTDSSTGISATSIRGNAGWSDYSFEVDVKPITFNDGGVSILFRAVDTSSCYFLYMYPTGISLQSRDNGASTELASYAFTYNTGTKYKIKLILIGSKIEVYQDNETTAVISVNNSAHAAGRIGFETWQASANFDNVKVTGSFAVSPEYGEVSMHISNVERNLAVLNQKLQIYDNQEQKPREIIASKQVADIFLQYAKDDLESGFIELALKEAEDTENILNTAISSLDNGMFYLSAEKSVRGKSLKDGHFYNSSQQAFFPRGIIWFGDSTTADGLSVYKNLGINLINSYFTTPSNIFPQEGTTAAFPSDLQACSIEQLRTAYDNNLLVDSLWQPQDFPQWFIDKYPEAVVNGNHFFDVDPDNPYVKEIIENSVKWNMDGLLQNPDDWAMVKDALLGFDLHNEPEIGSLSTYTYSNLKQFLQQKYVTIADLNSQWGTNYSSFDNINDVDTLMNKNRTVYSDWSKFNFDRFTNYFSWFRDTINKYGKGVNFEMYTKTDENSRMLSPFNNSSTIDLESLSDVTSCLGTDTFVTSQGNANYNLDWVKQSFLFDLYKSFYPDKPIIDPEWHSVDSIDYQNKNIPQGHIREALRLAAWHGLSGLSIWTFARPGSEWFYDGGNMFGQPHVVNEYITEAQTIENEMDRIIPFTQAQKDIYILYSLDSKVSDYENYLYALNKAYQAFYFEDANVGFITDKMLKDPAVMTQKNVKMLVVPNARYMSEQALNGLKDLSQKGVPIVFIGDGPKYDDNGKPLADTSLSGPVKRISIGTLESYVSKTRSILNWGNFTREYTLVDQNMNHPRFIEARFAKQGDKTIGYAVNLGNENAKFVIVDTEAGQAVNVNEYKYGKTDTAKLCEIELAPRQYISFDISDTTGIPYPFTWSDVLSGIQPIPDEPSGTDIQVGGPVEGVKTSSPVIIDGSLNDWQDVSSFKLNHYSQVRVMSDWTEDDISGTGYVKWDSSKLYLALEVKDNVHDQQYTDGDIWQGDAVQIAFDSARGSAPGSAGYTEVGFARTNSDTIEKYRWNAINGKTEGTFANAECAISRDDVNKITNYEISIPWTEIVPNGTVIGDNFLIGLSVLIADSDGTGRKGWIEYNSGIGNIKDPLQYGDLYLRP